MIHLIEEVPAFVVLPRVRVADKKVALNLNIYRNADKFLLNDMKKHFTASMEPYLKGLVIQAPFIIRYHLTLGSHRKADVANICSIFDKFFSDALVHYGCVPDDNHNFLKGVSYEYAGYKKGHNFITVEIIEL